MLVTSPFRPRSYGVASPFAQVAFAPTRPVPHTAGPSVRGQWLDHAYQFVVDLPGVPESAIEVSVAGPVLSLSVNDDSANWTHSVRLPQSLDATQVSAQYLNGRLTVTVGKAAAPESRSITINTEPAASIDTQPVEIEAVDTTETESEPANPQPSEG